MTHDLKSAVCFVMQYSVQYEYMYVCKYMSLGLSKGHYTCMYIHACLMMS